LHCTKGLVVQVICQKNLPEKALLKKFRQELFWNVIFHKLCWWFGIEAERGKPNFSLGTETGRKSQMNIGNKMVAVFKCITVRLG
jgi:hypothetical protein